MAKLVVPPDAAAAQWRSSDPRKSVWVSANAGAGKTYVLAQRVVRLLLNGVPPRSILCLTFTTAAAAEMETRVYKELAELALLDDADLARKIAALEPDVDPALAAQRARTLFAQALETPGGLKVQTLHAFAAALLKRFPLEANISGSFAVLDDAAEAEIVERCVADTLSEALDDPGGPAAAAIASLVPHITDGTISDAVAAVVKQRDKVIDIARRGLDADAFIAAVRETLTGGDHPGPPILTAGDIEALCEAFRADPNDAERRELLQKSLSLSGDARDELMCTVLLTAQGQPAKRVPRKAVRVALPEVAERWDDEANRLVRYRAYRRAEELAAVTLALLALGQPALERFFRETRQRGLIDYDQQIETAAKLVGEAQDAAWVRFKLDEGIDHIMLDEAQDTSPAQWALVDALTEEFFAGEGARAVNRTLFVVGDEKQSIYSFQGAAPWLFGARREFYHERAEEALLPFATEALAYSFRSVPQVLSAVDRVFLGDADALGATSDVIHKAVRGGPGRVEVWPLLEADDGVEPQDWTTPIDVVADGAGAAKLAREIADAVVRWTTEAAPDGGPPVRCGDIMILARKRGDFVPLMNRALKDRRVACAGADRLVVTEHIAVKDMVALARALLSPDDLSLAAVLRSPLFDIDESTLFALCHARPGRLLDALADGDDAARAIHATLLRWRGYALRERPFSFLARILIGEGMRSRFAARLGEEAEDALDALLDIAIAFEGTAIPTLETFLSRLARSKEELKRIPEGDSDAVRVMTVHGAKGLEAKLVVLADVGSGRRGGSSAPTLTPVDGAAALEGATLPVYAPRKDFRIPKVQAVLDAAKAAEDEESLRLLYVAMTRAEDHLIVCGAYDRQKPKPGMWHERVRTALGTDAEALTLPFGEGLVWHHPKEEKAPPSPPTPQRVPTPEPLPEWLHRPAAPTVAGPEPLTPSAAPGEGGVVSSIAAASPNGDALTARSLPAAEYGVVVHAILERALADPGASLVDLTAAVAPQLCPEERVSVANELAQVAALPLLAQGEAFAEVDLIGDVVLEDGTVRRAFGRADRIQRTADGLFLIDFKSDRAPGSVAADVARYARQLAVYRALLQGIDPDRQVSAFIVWTANASVLDLTERLPAIRPARPS